MSLLIKFKSIFEYITLMGWSWFLFRVKYELLKKINYFDIVNGTILKKVNRTNKKLFIYNKVDLLGREFIADKSFIKKADMAINGKIYAFSHEYLDYSVDGKIDWHRNPISKIEANRDLAWNKLPDFGEYGDIKLIWEASHFPQVYFFINAYIVTNDKKYATSCIEQIVDWIDKNPYPHGVNYKCGQEISFRLFAWINAMNYFDISKEDESKIVKNIYTSLLRVDANIDYASKSVRNNHSISEASGLFIGGLLFPQFKESKKWIKKGLKYLLNETSYQVYRDGSYIQHSFTYQRLALDIISFVIAVADKKDFKLPKVLKDRHLIMAEFLNSFMQDNGWLPNYGANDGANLFPIDSSDYRDFRRSLKSVFGEFSPKKRLSFEDGGYYIMKNRDIFTFIRCHSYRDRPSHNDSLHLDVWYRGKNIFCDAGTYSYNTDKKFKNNFIGLLGHNSVMINDKNQMKQILNFGWSNWVRAKRIEHSNYGFMGEHYAYQKEFGITHNREVKILENRIVIIDNVFGITSNTNIKQIWNTKDNIEIIDEYSLKVNNCIISSNIKYRLEDSFISNYYNSYIIGKRVLFEIESKYDFKIKTVMEFI